VEKWYVGHGKQLLDFGNNPDHIILVFVFYVCVGFQLTFHVIPSRTVLPLV